MYSSAKQLWSFRSSLSNASAEKKEEYLCYLVSLIFSRACTHASNLAIRSFTPLYLRLDKPAHLFRFCNNFASPQILTQPSDFSRFWDTLATFLTTFFRILGHIRVLPPPFRQLRRGAAAPLWDLYHNVFAATAFWLQTSTLQAL